MDPTDDDTPPDVPKCPDCGAEVGADLHRCTPEVTAADDIADLFTDVGEAGA